MRKIFDILLIVAILVGVAYACSSDYMEPYEESLIYNTYDSREELILITDSIPLESGVETLAIGENMVDVNQQIPIHKVMQEYRMHDGSCRITMTVSVLASTDSLSNFIYPTSYQQVHGYPVTVDVTIPDKVGSGVAWTYHSSRATISSNRSIRVEVRGTFHDYMGFFKKDTYQNVTVHESKSIGL